MYKNLFDNLNTVHRLKIFHTFQKPVLIPSQGDEEYQGIPLLNTSA